MKDFNYFEDNEDISFDLTPLIDVIFMLLIFFMIAATFNQTLIDIVLPKAQNTEMAKREQPVEVVITNEGKIFFEKKELSVEDIGSFITQHSQQKIWLQIDRIAPFEIVLKFIDEAKAKKYENLSFMVDKQ